MARPFKCVCDRNPSYFQFVKYHAALRVNGLIYVEEIPKELSHLNALGRQLVQWVKPFHTIIRLGTCYAPVLRSKHDFIKTAHAIVYKSWNKFRPTPEILGS